MEMSILSLRRYAHSKEKIGLLVWQALATLVDEDTDLDSIVTHFNKAVTDTAAKLPGKQRRKRKP